MSIKVMSAVFETSPQKENKLLALLILANNANDEGWAFPGQGRIARYLRTDVRAAQRILDTLEAEGEVIIYNRINLDNPRRHYSNCYHLAKYGDAAAPPPAELRGLLKARSSAIDGKESGNGSATVRGNGSATVRSVTNNHHKNQPLQRAARGEIAGVTGDPGKDERRAYYMAYCQAFPEAARPEVNDSQANKNAAQFLYANGYTLIEVSDYVTGRIAAGKVDYLFHYLQDDLPRERLKKLRGEKAAPAPSSSGGLAGVNLENWDDLEDWDGEE